MTTIVYRADGHRDELGAELGRGGEGAVYTVRGNDLDCAKLYHKPLAPDTARKLHLMVENPPHDPAFDTLKHRSIAWPSATLFADRGFDAVTRGGRAVSVTGKAREVVGLSSTA